ncbi:hypothetical protein ABK040_015494 [Willaertia magna]
MAEEIGLFKQEISIQIQKEIIPYFIRTPEVEDCLINFIKHDPVTKLSKVLTLFEPPGTGKTEMLKNLHKYYNDIYSVYINAFSIVEISIIQDCNFYKAWRILFSIVESQLSELIKENKTKSLTLKNTNLLPIDFETLSTSFSNRYQDSFLFIHLDNAHRMEEECMKELFLTSPCTARVKVILSGNTPLSSCIRTNYLTSVIPCCPLRLFDQRNVHQVLSHLLYWEELKIKNLTEDESEKVKLQIEENLVGTPRILFLFLKQFWEKKGAKEIDFCQLFEILEEAFSTFKNRQYNLLHFGFVRVDKFTLQSVTSNPIINVLMPFHRSGLIRMNELEEKTILSIPSQFSARFISEYAVYFPKDWLKTVCDSERVSVKEKSIQIWLALLLINQQSPQSCMMKKMISEKTKFNYLRAKWKSDSLKFDTIEELTENTDIDNPVLLKDSIFKSFVDFVISYRNERQKNEDNYEENGDEGEIKLIVRITSQKEGLGKLAKEFFGTLTNMSKKRKRNCFTKTVALFLTVFPLGEDTNAKTAKLFTKEQSSFVILELSKHNYLFPGMDLTSLCDNSTLLQNWIEKDNFLWSPPQSTSPFGLNRIEQTTKNIEVEKYGYLNWDKNDFGTILRSNEKDGAGLSYRDSLEIFNSGGVLLIDFVIKTYTSIQGNDLEKAGQTFTLLQNLFMITPYTCVRFVTWVIRTFTK